MSSDGEYIPDERELLNDVAEDAVFNISLLEVHTKDSKNDNENSKVEAPVKKTRGRPRKIVDHNAGGTNKPLSSGTGKKRGRPKGNPRGRENELEQDDNYLLETIDERTGSKKKKKKTDSFQKLVKNNGTSYKTDTGTLSIEAYLPAFNRNNEAKQDLNFSKKESLKDQLTLLTKGQLKFEKIVGTTKKEELIKYAKCLSWFKTPIPEPTKENERIKYLPIEPIPTLDTQQIKILSQNTQVNKLVAIPFSHPLTRSKKQKLTFDDTSIIYELDTNQSVKMPEKICGTERKGFILNHGIDTQVTSTKWVTFENRQFFIVSKILGCSFLDKAFDSKLAMFYNVDTATDREELNYVFEIWEFKKNVGLIMLKDYMHSFGVVTQMDVLPGSIKTNYSETSSFIEFLLVFRAQSEGLKMTNLNTNAQQDESLIELITTPEANIRYLNDKITSYCLISATLVCVGTYTGRVAVYDMNVSSEIPILTARFGDTLVDQLISIDNTSVVAASLYDGQVILFDYKNINNTITTIAKNRWISPPIIGSTDFTKGVLHTDGQRSLFSSPLNCLDAKTCALDIATIISCFEGSKQHPYILVGTSNGEVNITNPLIKSLLSKRHQSECMYCNIFKWKYDETKKIYQLDGTYEVEKTIKPRGAHEVAFGYKGCSIKKCEWLNMEDGERYYSFTNSAGITVITKFD